MDKQIIISAAAVHTAPTTALITAPTALPPAEQLGDYATSRNLTTSSNLGMEALYRGMYHDLGLAVRRLPQSVLPPAQPAK
jgi:hypothetical protein